MDNIFLTQGNTNENIDTFIRQVTLIATSIYSKKLLLDSKSIASEQDNELDDEKLKNAYDIANRELKKSKIKNYICTALNAANNDIRDVAKIISAALLPLSLSGKINLPVSPLIYAVIVVIIFDMGVNLYCKDFNKK